MECSFRSHQCSYRSAEWNRKSTRKRSKWSKATKNAKRRIRNQWSELNDLFSTSLTKTRRIISRYGCFRLGVIPPSHSTTTTVHRLHFEECTGNNQLKNGKISPDQVLCYFSLFCKSRLVISWQPVLAVCPTHNVLCYDREFVWLFWLFYWTLFSIFSIELFCSIYIFIFIFIYSWLFYRILQLI